MKTSKFQFTNPVLSELQFRINDEYSSEQEEINVGLSISVSKRRISETEALVELTLEIGEKEKESPFYIMVAQGARFRWENGAFDENGIERFLSINAPALLISYLRPIVANITMASQYPAYNIPFIDFNDMT